MAFRQVRQVARPDFAISMMSAMARPSRLGVSRDLCGRDLDPQELPADDEVVAVPELALGLQADVRAVSAVPVGERDLPARLLDLAVRRAHVEVTREVEVAALAADLQPARARAHRHAGRATLQDLRDAEGALVLRRRVEVRAVGRGAVARLRRLVDAKELLAGEELVGDLHLERAAHAEEDAVERTLVAHHELAVSVEEVRVLRADERVVREDELPVAPDDVLLGVELV